MFLTRDEPQPKTSSFIGHQSLVIGYGNLAKKQEIVTEIASFVAKGHHWIDARSAPRRDIAGKQCHADKQQ